MNNKYPPKWPMGLILKKHQSLWPINNPPRISELYGVNKDGYQCDITSPDAIPLFKLAEWNGVTDGECIWHWHAATLMGWWECRDGHLSGPWMWKSRTWSKSQIAEAIRKFVEKDGQFDKLP